MKRTFLVTSFRCTLGSKLASDTRQYQAVIRCGGASAELLEIYFLDRDRGGQQNESDALPNKSELLEGVKVYGRMYAPIQQYGFYLDLLRNQEPIQATVGFEEHQAATCIESNWEEVGAGEVMDAVT